MTFRTDRNNNPAAVTTDLAKQAGLVENRDYVHGDPFTIPTGPGVTRTYFTAKLLGDPIAQTIRLIDAVGYYTQAGGTRWVYIAIPKFLWDEMSPDQKRDIVGFHYLNEGGTEMRALFPHYGDR